ncbi:hypothetical protein LMTR13_08905 [Bradyrhizobium icense]|uniref:Uncharacterized protein n=1 Tax=Bradyrhizobium icense TaxID=1274631 RepID=A0A1B1UC09_9BRAD|nr:hypothetical protein LMTR13_08905 [Bradyrhizobium icense]
MLLQHFAWLEREGIHMLLVSEPVLGADEKAALAAVIDSGWVTMGDRVHEFGSGRRPILQDEQHQRPANSGVRPAPERAADWWPRRLSAKPVWRERDFIR